jgi:cytochrome c-type biogenesis protein CcmH
MVEKLFMLFAFALLFSHAVTGLRAQSALPPLTQAQKALVRRIEGRVMAPCCYTQTIRDHDSQVAVDMRNEVTALVASGKSEQEIITYYRTKYGETILVVPDGLQGQLLTFLPMIGFLLATGGLCLFIRRSIKATSIRVAQIASNGTDSERTALQQRIRAEVGDV